MDELMRKLAAVQAALDWMQAAFGIDEEAARELLDIDSCRLVDGELQFAYRVQQPVRRLFGEFTIDA